jgi:hypothetical protein
VFARVCLHTEAKGGVYRAYSTNHIGVPDKFPAGTELSLLRANSDGVTLADARSGREIRIEFVKKHTLMPIDRWFGETFSDTPIALPASLTAEERLALQRCEAVIGMSRPVFFLALGYPPASLTPNRNGPSLRYDWKRFNRRVFEFDGEGKLTAIRD